MSKPKIYGYCPAGCKWETVHKEDFEKSASLIVQHPDENGRFILEKGKEYKIVCEKSENGDGSYSFGKVIFYQNVYDAENCAYDLTTSDKYAQFIVFRFLESYKGTDGLLHLVYEVEGVRYDAPTDRLFASGTSTTRAYIKAAYGLSVFLYNADATVTLQAATVVSTELIGQDANGGNIYRQTFSDGKTAEFVAPKGETADEERISALEHNSIVTVQMVQEHEASISALNKGVAECTKTEDLPLVINHFVNIGDTLVKSGASVGIDATYFNRVPIVDEYFVMTAYNVNGNVYCLRGKVADVGESSVTCKIAAIKLLHDEKRISTLEESASGTKRYRHQIVSGSFTESGDYRLYVVSSSQTPITQPHEVNALLMGGGRAYVNVDGITTSTVIAIAQPQKVYYFENGSIVSKDMSYGEFTDIVTEVQE